MEENQLVRDTADILKKQTRIVCIHSDLLKQGIVYVRESKEDGGDSTCYVFELSVPPSIIKYGLIKITDEHTAFNWVSKSEMKTLYENNELANEIELYFLKDNKII